MLYIQSFPDGERPEDAKKTAQGFI